MMKNKTIYIHVGQPKCGSKSLQGNFFNMHPQLKLFTKYMGTSESMELTNELEKHICHSETLNLDEGITASRKLAINNSNQTVVFSLEGITSSSRLHYADKLERLGILFRDQCRIIIAFREPVALIKSIFWQMIHYYRNPNVSEYNINRWITGLLKNYDFKIQSPIQQLQPASMLEKYCEVFGENNVFPFLLEELKEEKQELYDNLTSFMRISPIIAGKEKILNSTKHKNKKNVSIKHLEIVDTINDKVLDLIYNFTRMEKEKLYQFGLPVKLYWK